MPDEQTTIANNRDGFQTWEVDEWKKLNLDERRFLTGGRYHPIEQEWATFGAPNKTYFLPFQFAIMNPALACSPGLHVHYTFDLNKQFKNHAIDLFGLLKLDTESAWTHRLGSLTMESSEVALGLQAADLFAYQSYKYAKHRIEHGKPIRIKDLPLLLRHLLTNMKTELARSDATMFAYVSSQIAILETLHTATHASPLSNAGNIRTILSF